MEHLPPPLFERGPAPATRLVFFVIAAIVLMVLDSRFRYAEALRQGLVLAAYPLQRAAVAPISLAEQVGEFFVSQAALQREVAQLRDDKLRAAKDLVTMQSLQSENQKLRQLLEARARISRGAQFAEVIYLGRDPFSRKVIVDKGTQHSIEAGQPVIDAYGLIGQVTRAHPLVAEVTLIIDKDHAIPVEVVRNGVRGVAFGSGDGETIELRFMAANADVQIGDALVTSGLDGIYPVGLPVARVARIDKDSAFTFARILCTPVGGPGQNRELLILSKAQPPPAYPDEEPAATPKRSQRGRKGR